MRLGCRGLFGYVQLIFDLVAVLCQGRILIDLCGNWNENWEFPGNYFFFSFIFFLEMTRSFLSNLCHLHLKFSINLHLKKRWDIPRQREGGEKDSAVEMASTAEVASTVEMVSSLR